MGGIKRHMKTNKNNIRWEFKEISEITNLTTWVISDTVFSNRDNPIYEFSNEVIVKEAVNILYNGNFKEWSIIEVKPFYTKNTIKNKDGMAGKFWLGITIYMKKELLI